MAGRLVAEHVTKRFASVTALDDVSIEFLSGEIHAVLGENGAGKSTLMHILAGFLSPSSGQVLLDGAALPADPHRTRKLGIEMVHQHFTLVPNFTVAENLALAKIDRLSSVIETERLAESALQAGQQLGWDLDPRAKVSALPVGTQQRIEILKCLAGDASILIFDEPTAVLVPDEVLDLIRVLKELKAKGKTVILIAHKLSEVMTAADRVTVLRAGRKVASAMIGEVDELQLATWMVGDLPQRVHHAKDVGKEIGLTVSDIHVLGDRRHPAVRCVSFEVHQSEILGIGGVDGNGQIELAECLALVRKPSKGERRWKGTLLEEAELRIAYIPQDRQQDGLALDLTIEDNFLIEGINLPRLRYGPFIVSNKTREWAQHLLNRFEIKASGPNQAVGDLSGGNQQKIVVSRNLDVRPDVLIAVNPTRGLDVRATEYVHRQIVHARDSGTAVVLFTTDLDELSALSDRILYMSRGVLTAEQGALGVVGGSR